MEHPFLFLYAFLSAITVHSTIFLLSVLQPLACICVHFILPLLLRYFREKLLSPGNTKGSNIEVLVHAGLNTQRLHKYPYIEGFALRYRAHAGQSSKFLFQNQPSTTLLYRKIAKFTYEGS